MPKQTPERIGGFTVLEMLLASVIFALISLGLYATFFIAVKTQSNAQALHAVCRDMRSVFDALALDLENARFFDFSGSYPDSASMKGSSDKIAFLGADQHGLKMIEYYLGRPSSVQIYKTIIGQHVRHLRQVITSSEEADNRIFLMRRETPWASYVNHNDRGIREEVMASSVKKDSLKFSYAVLRTDGGQKKVDFQDVWDKKDGLPAVVRMTIVFVAKNTVEQSQQTLEQDVVLPLGTRE